MKKVVLPALCLSPLHATASVAARTAFSLELDGKATEFLASVAVDDESGGKGSVEFELISDSRKLWSSGTLNGGQKPRRQREHGYFIPSGAIEAGCKSVLMDHRLPISAPRISAFQLFPK